MCLSLCRQKSKHNLLSNFVILSYHCYRLFLFWETAALIMKNFMLSQLLPWRKMHYRYLYLHNIKSFTRNKSVNSTSFNQYPITRVNRLWKVNIYLDMGLCRYTLVFPFLLHRISFHHTEELGSCIHVSSTASPACMFLYNCSIHSILPSFHQLKTRHLKESLAHSCNAIICSYSVGESLKQNASCDCRTAIWIPRISLQS